MTRLTRSLSLWSSVFGFAALLIGRRDLTRWCWRLCGWGGIGAVYGAYAAYHELPIEPLAVGGHYLRHADPDVARSFLWHALFLVGAERI